MSRSITIGYRPDERATFTQIEVRAPYYLLGTQMSSMEFWSLPRLGEVGISRLTALGVCDPVYFIGWGDLALLGTEIALLQIHLPSIDFHPEQLAQWVAHLVYCHSLLTLTTPSGFIPELTIG